MIRVTLEMIPHGSGTPYKIGEMEIANDGTGTSDVGNYDVVLMKSPHIAKTPGVWKKGRIQGFPRNTLGPYDLLYRCLGVTVGSRNRSRV